jgi:hypothetical protein
MKKIHLVSALIAIALFSLVAITIISSRQRRLEDRILQLEGQARSVASVLGSVQMTEDQNTWTLAMMQRAMETAWVDTPGAPLQVRMAAEADEFFIGTQLVHLVAEIRNASNHEVAVTEPLFEPATIKLWVGGKQAVCLGSYKSRLPPRPVRIPPGRIARAMLELMPSDFAELSGPGLFTVEWQYGSHANVTGAAKVTWEGTLTPVKATWRTNEWPAGADPTTQPN